MKTHVHFSTSDLSRSVEFYQTLLQSRPATVRTDYALFVTDDPGFELALSTGEQSRMEGAHFGLAVASVAEVNRAIERLRAGGYETAVEREATCCYANQTKVWTADPDGRRWEVYTVHRETDQRDSDDPAPCCPA